jgi:arylsulfatase A-like enzyme
VPAGQTVDSMTTSIDLAPTFLAIGHAQPPAQQDGISMLDLWHGQPAPPDWQQAVLIEHHGPVKYLSDPDFQGVRSGDPPSYEAVRTKTFLYVEYTTGEHEYYDLVHDPYENDNSYGSLSAQRKKDLHQALARFSVCNGAAECQHAATSGRL